MSSPMLTLCSALLLLLVLVHSGCHAQLSLHTDANTNSFTLKTPGLQQSFTRYYGAAKTQPQQEALQQQQQLQQPQQEQQQQQEQQLQYASRLASFAPTGLHYSTAYPLRQSYKAKVAGEAAVAAVTPQQHLQQQHQQQLSAQQQQQQAQPQQQQQVTAQQAQQIQQQHRQVVASMPTYADQMQAAFADYQRQRLEFEQQQQQLLDKLYSYYPDISQGQQQQQQQPQYQYQSRVQPQQQQLQFGSNNGLQQQQQQPSYQQQQRLSSVAQLQQGQTPFYSTQHHLGFLQQQQQDILRDQQQNVAQQYASASAGASNGPSSTSGHTPLTSQNWGMPIPEASVVSSPTYQSSADVSHVKFSSGNLNYNF